ncbi:phosphate signaling complex protein PhoU [Candidatus Poriferisocius sp.]|uniref:phosphate signaling complex protein PhoU n=1 Tax=Candidatus Poriferisocius sp. TaxID=3101276 RepID=UPI003B013037
MQNEQEVAVGELRKSFHEELDEIQTGIVHMAALVTEAVPRATESLLESNLELAQQLINADDRLDDLSVHLEERCHNVLALQAPMAGDLRALSTALRLNAELERSGDLAVNIAKATRRIYGTRYDAALRGLLVRMSEEACRLVRLAIDSYVDGNAGLAAALDDIDDQLDNLNRECVQAVFQAHNEGSIDLQAAVHLCLISRYYERIGDHAVNIGERVVYMVTGWLPEYTGSARLQMRKDYDIDSEAPE